MIRSSIFSYGALVLGYRWLGLPLNGIWLSRGYGEVFRIAGPDLQAFEVTTKTCVAGSRAKRTTISSREAVFKIIGGGALVLKSGDGSDHKLANFDFSESDIQLDRLPQFGHSAQLQRKLHQTRQSRTSNGLGGFAPPVRIKKQFSSTWTTLPSTPNAYSTRVLTRSVCAGTARMTALTAA